MPEVAREVPTVANRGISADGTRITFHLRHGVRWQDGIPLTSRDVVFTYRAVMNPRNAIPSRYGYDRISSVEAPDPYTVVVMTRSAVFADRVDSFSAEIATTRFCPRTSSRGMRASIASHSTKRRSVRALIDSVVGCTAIA